MSSNVHAEIDNARVPLPHPGRIGKRPQVSARAFRSCSLLWCALGPHLSLPRRVPSILGGSVHSNPTQTGRWNSDARSDLSARTHKAAKLSNHAPLHLNGRSAVHSCTHGFLRSHSAMRLEVSCWCMGCILHGKCSGAGGGAVLRISDSAIVREMPRFMVLFIPPLISATGSTWHPCSHSWQL